MGPSSTDGALAGLTVIFRLTLVGVLYATVRLVLGRPLRSRRRRGRATPHH